MSRVFISSPTFILSEICNCSNSRFSIENGFRHIFHKINFSIALAFTTSITYNKFCDYFQIYEGIGFTIYWTYISPRNVSLAVKDGFSRLRLCARGPMDMTQPSEG